MPPIKRITKEDIVEAAIDLIRESGEASLSARAIATKLSCSTQPVFSCFANMEALRAAVIEAVDKMCNAYMKEEAESGKYPFYKSFGLGYIRFAREEKALFHLLYMRDRSGETIPESNELLDHMADVVQQATGLDRERALRFHLSVWTCVHGIATMLATSYLDLGDELICEMITEVYQGLRKQYEGGATSS